ncbi:phage major capsid protein [Diaphorobacter caeni]|uniref:phage major capsid protein n=1 Tax=Diaphorobacter caeni TaxID=2784387 RepID=UPI001E4079ED|nr:phage major capsid protein [Diaphorobacter caeni]
MKTIIEQISDLENTRAAKAARMNDVMQKALEEGRTTDASEGEEFDTLQVEIKTIDADLVRLKALEQVQIAQAKAVPQTPSAPNESKVIPTVKATPRAAEKGIDFARYAMCVAKAKGNPMLALEVAKANYPERGDLQTVFKAAVSAGTTTAATWAKPLVEYENYTGDFIEYLRPATILGKFGQSGIPGLRRVPFNVKIAGQTSGGTASWVGEGKAKPLTKFDFSTVQLGFAKVAGISVLTDELLRFSNPAAEGLVRDSLRDCIVERLDKDFIDPAKAAVAGVSPASITNGVVAVVTSGNTGSADELRADLKKMFQNYIAAGMAPTTGVLIMSSTAALNISLMQNPLGQQEFPGLTMNGGVLAGLPVIVSDYVPAGTVIMLNASDVYLADDGVVDIAVSSEASLEMSDAPAQDAGAGTGASLVSMFQTNSVAIRAERYINWAKRRAAAVIYVTGAVWAGATPTP